MCRISHLLVVTVHFLLRYVWKSGSQKETRKLRFDRGLMSFSFNFVSSAEHASLAIDPESSEAFTRVEKNQTEKGNSSFTWIQDEVAKFCHQDFLQNKKTEGESISLVHEKQNEHDTNNFVIRVQEESTSFQNQSTDLIPGIYEGGLKVWECSIDLCRHFLRNNVAIKGHVLELGCGHGLPGIWILKQAIAKSRPNSVDCFLTFSDYNGFVIRDVTIPNVAINVRDSCFNRLNSINGTNQIKHLLRENIAFGAGDWLAMSDILLGKNTPCAHSVLSMPPASPRDGLFDCILASETTYSENSAKETAELLSRHMKPGIGVAYISTKRYYFGVGGGTKCLCDCLQKQKYHKFHIKTLEVYDNGAGNIRELLLVKSLGLEV